MASTARLSLILVAVFLIAGCQAPTPSTPTAQTESPTATEPSSITPNSPTPASSGINITVRNGSLPVDAGQVFTRMQQVLGTNVTPPAYVELVAEPDDLAPGNQPQLPRSWRILGMRPGGINESQRSQLENGVTTGFGGIRLYLPENTSPTTTEWLLAHEFVHYITIQQDHGILLASNLPDTTDAEIFVTRAIVEGVAVYATNAYIERYGLETEPNSQLYQDLRPSITDGSIGQFSNDAYISGYRYVLRQTSSPTAIASLFQNSPNTSEQVLHPSRPSAESPSALSIRSTDSGGWRAIGQDTLGEAFIRTILDRTHSFDRASNAATGWGNDSLVIFRHPNRTNASYGWVLRWDDRENASQFHDAITTHFASLRDGSSDTDIASDQTQVSIQRVDDRTLIVLIGPAGFIEGIEVRADWPTVRITLP